MSPNLLVLVSLVGLSLGMPTPEAPGESCFLLEELDSGRVERSSSEICDLRVTPASTFKIPHALAALDVGVIHDESEVIEFDGGDVTFEAWRRDHTLATAVRNSVVWYFQRIAERLGSERERDYLTRFDFGNADVSSGLTTFWLGGSLLVSPEEQLRFLRRLYQNDLPVSERARSIVQRILIQPSNALTSALGEQPFSPPWPEGTVLSAKTGRSRDASGKEVRWFVGHVAREGRAWVFVSCVVGDSTLSPSAAIDFAASSLRSTGVI